MDSIERGSALLAVNPLTDTEYPARVFSCVQRHAPCVLLHTENGVKMPVSLGGRVRTIAGWMAAADMHDQLLLTRTPNGIAYSRVKHVEDIGWHPVRNAAIEEEGAYEETGCFWAGSEAGYYGAHHNIKNS
jgi:hypothetical protein